MNEPLSTEGPFETPLLEEFEDDELRAILQRQARKRIMLKETLANGSDRVSHPEPPKNIPDEPFSLTDLISPPKCGILPPKTEAASHSKMPETSKKTASDFSTLLADDNTLLAPDSMISHVESAAWTPPVRGVMATRTPKPVAANPPQEKPVTLPSKPTVKKASFIKNILKKSDKATPASAAVVENEPPAGTSSSALPKQVKPLQDAETRFKERQKHLQALIDKDRGKVT